MKLRIVLLIMIVSGLSILLSGCGLYSLSVREDQDPISAAQTIVAQTLAAQNGQMDVGGDLDQDFPSEDETPAPPESAPAITPTPTITLTPTLSVPMVSVSVNTNCRTGPGKVYDWLGALLVGEQAEVMARSADGQYWVIRNPDNNGGLCWLWGNYATVEGPIVNLQVWDPPPTPTPTRDWDGTWTVWIGSEGGGSLLVDGQMSVNISGENFTGALTLMGKSVDINGVINADHTTASGTWTSDADAGPFTFYWISGSQFNGNWNGTGAWCGARDGDAQPDPCLKP